MATSSRTDVTALRRLYAEKTTSRRFSKHRSVESKESSNWFDGINSNAPKRSKRSHGSAIERSHRHSNAHTKRSQEQSEVSVEKNTHELRSHLNGQKQFDLHCTSSVANSNEQSKKTKESNVGNELNVETNSQESYLTNGHSDVSVDTSAQPVKQNEKRGFRKKMANAEGVKRLKHSTTSKKDNSWRQNSRSRRLVANARERSRIHILSDAFENLRRAVPSYSQDQKLSKLAILKLATYYISALANLAESDTSARSLKQFADCVSHCTKALQTEGRSRRKHF